MTKKQTILIISDTQAPYHHADSIEFLKAVKKKYRPTDVVQIGDLVDNYRFSQYDQAPEADSITTEYFKARQFITDLGKVFPKMTITIGNHDLRYYKAAAKAGIPESFVKPLEEILGFPKGWNMVLNKDFETKLGKVRCEHGHEVTGGSTKAKNAVLANSCSTVVGHFHTEAGITWISTREKLMFFMPTGCLFDTHSIAGAYGKGNKIRPLIGCSVIVDGMPSWIPMPLDKDGRFTGKL